MDPQYLKKVRTVGCVGLSTNLLLSVFKVGAGWIGRSHVVVADGLHSLTDVLTDLTLLVGVRFWSAPPDEYHPHGHRRIETAITVMIGFLLTATAVGIVFNALTTLHIRHENPPGMIALVAAITSIVVKESLYRWTSRMGRRVNSTAVLASAWHHRSDALSSIPAALAVAGARISPDWYFLDHVGAILVSLFILQAAWKVIWPAVKELTDTGAGPDVHKRIEEISLETDGVLGVHKCRTRRLGFILQVDIHVQVRPDVTVREGHEIASAVKHRLLAEGPNVLDVLTHLEPFETKGVES